MNTNVPSVFHHRLHHMILTLSLLNSNRLTWVQAYTNIALTLRTQVQNLDGGWAPSVASDVYERAKADEDVGERGVRYGSGSMRRGERGVGCGSVSTESRELVEEQGVGYGTV